MKKTVLNRNVISAFAGSLYGNAGEQQIHVTPLRGGLESCGIARAVVERGRKHAGSFVVKPLPHASREVAAMQMVQRLSPLHVAPRLLGTRRAGRRTYLFLEWIPAAERWPWRDPDCAALVLEQLSAVHSCNLGSVDDVLRSWDYDADLAASAAATVEQYRAATAGGIQPFGRQMLRAMERTAAQVGRLRRDLVTLTGPALLHGDAHPQNAIIRKSVRGHSAVLVDWGRARLGSPLEDASSWLHSLSCWEPEARRKHDTLLRRYLEHRGVRSGLNYTLRDAIYVAGACNAMAGALRYHLWVIGEPSQTAAARRNAHIAAADWLRIIRRADASSGN